MSDKDAPPPYASPGPAGPWMLAKTTTTTKVTTTTTETHFFPLFRRRPNARQEDTAAASLRRSIDRDKALPLLPPSDSGLDSHGIGLGLPSSRKSADRDITPRAGDRDITPTPPLPVIIPATPLPATHISSIRDIRRVRSSGTLRESQPGPARRSEQSARDMFLASKPLPVPLSALPQPSNLPELLPPRTRQLAISSPSLNTPGPSSLRDTQRLAGPYSPQTTTLNTGRNQLSVAIGTRPTTLWAGDGANVSVWGAGIPQGWDPSQDWEHQQGRLGWENQAEFGQIGPVAAYRSLGSRERERDRERERERRPSAPVLTGGNVFQSPKSKGKERERDSLDPDPTKEKETGKRSILGRRPSFWIRKSKPKDSTDRRPSTSQQDSAALQRPSADATHLGAASGVNGICARRSLEARVGPSQSSSPRPSTEVYSPPPRRSANADIPPRSSVTSPRSSSDNPPDLSLPVVRPMTPLFSEFGVYRGSVDFTAAGGPGMLAALADRLATEGSAGVGETIEEGVEANGAPKEELVSSSPIPVPGTSTPPRRRMTGTSSLGRAASWRRSLVESAENWRRSLIGGNGNGGDEGRPGLEDVLNGSSMCGSPVSASASPVPWANSSPRASPIPRRSIPESAPASGRASPARRSRQESPAPRSRHASPVPLARGAMSPTGGARVTFGDESGRSRLSSLLSKARNTNGGGSSERNDTLSSSTAAGSGNTGLRRARSTSRLTAALSPSRSRSFSLFGPRPSSAGQPQTQQSRQRDEQPPSSFNASALGHTHPSAFGPATNPELSLTLSPPMMGTGGSGYPFPSPSAFGPQSNSSVPGTPMFAHQPGSQLSLGGSAGYGGSSVGHSQNGYLGSSGAGTFIAGSPNGSRTSSILLRSPLRPRSSTNPPLLRRLSGVFGNAGMSGRNPSGTLGEGLGLGVNAGSARPGSSKGPSPGASVPKRGEDDTPEAYLNKLLKSVSKTEIAGAIASKGDPFHVAALQLYMSRFNFVFDPLDIALRRLLMDLCLPKETQQIDRVMEGFAKRYAECNPGLFVSEDHAYILAFSLMMLHTDAFNKSNKNKMTKADYVKNTRMGGIPPEVLDCFFDNIVFAPFIFIEDATDVNGQRGFVPESIGGKGSAIGITASANSSGTLLASKPKIDPYYIITQNLLGPLRVPVDQYIPSVSPFSFTGTADRLDAVQLRRVFASNAQLEIAGIGAEPVRIGVNKSGLLSRKDDLLEGGRRAGSRKWRRWAVVLTGSQLLFFREASWAALVSSATEATGSAEPVQQTSSLKPEEVIPLKDTVALYDVNYGKYTHVFRFTMPSGKQQLIQAANEQDMNEWISRINYASALKSAGVRVRELVMNAEESRATGIAAAVSHARDRRLGKVSTPPSSWIGGFESEDAPRISVSLKSPEYRSNVSSEVELDAIVEPTDGGMKNTFDEIKAELASSYNTFPRSGLAPPRQTGYRANSLGAQRPSASSLQSFSTTEDGVRTRMTTRAEVVTSKIADLKSKISTTEVHLQNELRVARNFAVLAPFQLATRTRIRLAVEALARRIQVVRMDMAKLACHRDILLADLAAEEEEREQLKAVALQAAREQLQLSVPRMTLSVHDKAPEGIHNDSDVSASASATSLRSATDYPDPAEDPTLTAGKNDTSLTTPEIESEQLLPSPPRKSDTSLRPRPSFADSSRSGISQVSSSGNPHGSSAGQGGNSAGVNEEETEEQAEIWHATRAGRRVSLVELPPTPEGRKLSDLFRKHTNTSDVIGERVGGSVPA